MKKRAVKILFALIVTMGVMSACTKSGNIGSEASTTEPAKTQSVEVTKETKNQSIGASEETLRGLIKENLNCMHNIFILSMLPIEGEFVQDQWIYPVSKDAFADYAEFENYVRSVYCKETADLYLYNFPYENDPKYLNVDGKLYENKMYDGGKGYYANWDNYTIDIESSTETECVFTINCTVEWPAEKPVLEPYPVKGKAVLEDGKWVLTEMLS